MNAFTVILFALIFLSLVFTVYYVWSLFWGAPYVPSMGKSRKQIKELAEEYFKKNPQAQAVELGAGDCSLSFSLSDIGYSVSAYEINPFLTLGARFLSLLRGKNKVSIFNKDVFKASYNNSNLAVIYLYPHLMSQLEPILFGQMPKGSWIISNTFAFPNYKPIRVHDKIKVYEVI